MITDMILHFSIFISFLPTLVSGSFCLRQRLRTEWRKNILVNYLQELHIYHIPMMIRCNPQIQKAKLIWSMDYMGFGFIELKSKGLWFPTMLSSRIFFSINGMGFYPNIQHTCTYIFPSQGRTVTIWS